jgi:UDP-GlcNAc:undecaprenyl-phosphate GlcNAc-1-phosphate transferase
MEREYYFNIFFLFISLFLNFFIYFKRKKIAKFLGVIDYPNLKRKVHYRPTPKTASYSLFLTFALVLITNLIFKIYPSHINILLLSTICIFIVGFLDDKYNLSPYTKFLLSLLIIYLTINLSSNLIINKVYFNTFDSFLIMNNFSIFFTCLAVLLLINALNLSDGINGLALGIIFIWLFYILTKNSSSNLNLFILVILINLVIIFFYSYLGRHFLGDSGSLMLPTFISFYVITETNMSINNGLLPISAEQLLILFWLPGIDMLRLFIERLIRNQNPFSADLEHFHHFLLKNYSIKKSLLIYFTIINIPIILSWYLRFNSIIVFFTAIIFYFFFTNYLRFRIKPENNKNE